MSPMYHKNCWAGGNLVASWSVHLLSFWQNMNQNNERDVKLQVTRGDYKLYVPLAIYTIYDISHSSHRCVKQNKWKLKVNLFPFMLLYLQLADFKRVTCGLVEHTEISNLNEMTYLVKVLNVTIRFVLLCQIVGAYYYIWLVFVLHEFL